MVDLSELNSVQKDVVTMSKGPVMVLAGAGSGKTKTLVSKIAWLLESEKIRTSSILALTFSNKAAREMRLRVSKAMQVDAYGLEISTFHSFCARVLRFEADYLGLSKNFSIYDEAESKAIVKALLLKRGISTKELSPYEILSYIECLKNEGYYMGKAESDSVSVSVLKKHEFYSYFLDYEMELKRSNAMDFSGLITNVLALFDKHPNVLEKYTNRYEYLLVDEYQDTNRAQFELLLRLAGKRKNLCVVGDEDQTIYSWRGANIGNILDFEKYFPEYKLLKLEQNYRSTKNIIEAASCVIGKNVERKGKTMWTENVQGNEIILTECGTDKIEADFIASEISSLCRRGVNLKDIAVFYRANAQSRLIEDALRLRELSYRIVGGIRFYERKEVKDLIAYLRLVVNPKDSIAFFRVVNIPSRGIGAITLKRLEEKAEESKMSLLEYCVYAAEHKDCEIKISKKASSLLYQFVDLLTRAKAMNSTDDKTRKRPSLIFQEILSHSGYMDYLRATNRDYELEAREENVEELISAIVDFETENPSCHLEDFLSCIALDSSIESSALESADSITVEGQADFLDKEELSLMTVHGAKGLEFDYAFIVGAEEKVFPSFKSLEENSIEEERRLFYVAMTRAKKQLYISFAQGRMLFGILNFNAPSRFLIEIPKEYCEFRKIKAEKRTYTPVPMSITSPSKEKQKPLGHKILKGSFPLGTHVIHKVYGKGIVIQVEGSGKNEKALVKFSQGPVRRFMVQMAPLSLDEERKNKAFL